MSTQQPSPTPRSNAQSIQSAQATASIYRRLTWQATIPLEIVLAGSDKPNAPGSEDVGNEGGTIDRYYIQAPRHTYLPLLLPEIRDNFVRLARDEQDMAEMAHKEDEWWFEYAAEEQAATSGTDEEEEEEILRDAPETHVVRGTGEPCRWHWSIDLIDLHARIRSKHQTDQTLATRPLRLILHLSPPPTTATGRPQSAFASMGSNSIDGCRTMFVHQLKEADFVRWGHTRRITGLRRLELEAAWNSIVEADYELQARFASKILPLPVAPSVFPPAASPNPSAGRGFDTPSRPPSTDPSSSSSSSGVGPSSSSRAESVYTTKAIPIKLYLPDDVPVVQDVVPPMMAEGRPTTILHMLQTSLPSLFPKQAANDPYALARPILSGVELPPAAEVAWLSSCVAAPDGWLRIGILLNNN